MTNIDRLDIAIRAYTEKPKQKPVSLKGSKRGLDKPSDYALIFDCETTIDAGQSLRFGFYQIRKNGVLETEGIFYEEEALTLEEISTLEAYARENAIDLITAWEFRRDGFLRVGYQLRGAVIGFNLPFDISRIAISHGCARGSMRGGFSFRFSKDRRTPSVRVKHLSRQAALIDFAAPGLQETPRGARKRGLRTPKHRGYFIDVKTFAGALTPHKGSLASLCTFLKTKTRKHETDEHGQLLSSKYLDYGRADVQATWECYQKLSAKYAEHDLATPAHRIFSEAGIGKAYLEQMGILSLLAKQPEFPRDVFSKSMCAYYGGRAEVRIRREIRRVLYTDFKSMYPTVNALMHLWNFVIARKITMRDATEETRKLLDEITVNDLQSKAFWKKLTVLVKVKPDSDLLPVRAKYDGKCNTIGLNYLTSGEALYYTLADCIAAKLLSGKAPIIEEAILFEHSAPQRGLKSIKLFGKSSYRVDPKRNDGFKQFVDLRDEAKAKNDPVQQSIKIIANATSYGIFIEINRDNAPKPEPLNVYDQNSSLSEIQSKALEQPGKYFNPLLGVLITGAARLMLAIAERLTLDAGLQWVFCDTDSLAIAKPDGLSEEDFIRRASGVINCFKPLNPYRKSGSLLQIEDVNYATKDPKKLVPLYAFAISAKRYVLFNLDNKKRPIIRKASAHGLGHLMPPYTQKNAPRGIAKPIVPLSQIGVARWQYDLWVQIIRAALRGDADHVPLDYHPALNQPALCRYGATSPAMLGWFKRWNEGRSYAAQVKPFCFMTAFQARNGSSGEFDCKVVSGPQGRGRPKKRPSLSPVGPFERDPAKAVSLAFDRETGESVCEGQLKTYSEPLARYHLSPESKFRNADFYNSGRTERRNVHAQKINLIGKEGNNLETEGLVDTTGPTEYLKKQKLRSRRRKI